MMYRILTGFIIVLGLTTTSLANDIYVTQSGNTLDLDITQDGQNNTLGNSTTASASTGNAFNMDIDQIGDSNVIKYQVNGASYTGVISLTGNSNDVDLNCDSTAGNSSCGTVSASITMVGSSNDLDIDIGQTAAATGSEVTTYATPLTAAGIVRSISVVKSGCIKEAVKACALPNLLAVETVTTREEV